MKSEQNYFSQVNQTTSLNSHPCSSPSPLPQPPDSQSVIRVAVSEQFT